MLTLVFLSSWYFWLKSIHLISLIAWMAGIFYLPRLFVYHCQVSNGTEQSERFKIMERRLLKQIMTSAMISTWVFGVLLVLTPGVMQWGQKWWIVKLICLLGMTGFHGMCSRWRKDFLENRNHRTHTFFRAANEVPTILLVVIVIMVIVKPF